MPRISIAAMLAACAVEDERAMGALSPGHVWTRVLVDAHQVEGSSETSGSLRIYVERRLNEDGDFRYQLQRDNMWDDGWEVHDVGEKPEEGLADAPAEIVALYPFWAECARRHIKSIHEGERTYGREEWQLHDPLQGPRLCGVCAYDAGGRFIMGNPGGTPNKCPICRCVGVVHPLGSWEGFTEEFIANVLAKSGPEPLTVEEAVERILALNDGETYIELGRGPCISSQGDHSRASGYCWHEWSVRVLREKDMLTFSVQERADHRNEWSPTDFGVGRCGADRELGLEWYSSRVGERVARTLLTMRALRDQEEGDYDDPAWRVAHGVTEEHLRDRTLSETTLAELKEEGVAA